MEEYKRKRSKNYLRRVMGTEMANWGQPNWAIITMKSAKTHSKFEIDKCLGVN